MDDPTRFSIEPSFYIVYHTSFSSMVSLSRKSIVPSPLFQICESILSNRAVKADTIMIQL